MTLKEIFLLIFVTSPSLSTACAPIIQKKIAIPPLSPDKEFTYVYPKPEKDYFIQKIENSSNIAIVEIHVDHHYTNHPYDAQTGFIVLYGWGDPQPKFISIHRQGSSCGKPEKIEANSRYVAIFEKNKNPILIPLKEAEESIRFLGKPEYMHTSVGLLPREL
ncbi:hypothetical protein ACG1BZ_22440 [Microbulbifer sp. CNSA002]|uniref:hypothetical protein n=1 Tax=Microbulbifer sp. CNSA002 TaxID=3373604 RepID=UPI0039B4575A